MSKTYKCPECRESMEAKYKDTNDKTIWYCKKCDGFFGIGIPFKYILSESTVSTGEKDGS